MYLCQSSSFDVGNECILCWICLDERPDEAGQPPRWDCSCRGESAGFVHLFCLVKYAEQKSEDWDCHDLDQIREPWEVCPNCRQDYQNELALDLAAKIVTFVDRNMI